jgi:hypothetical protein
MPLHLEAIIALRLPDELAEWAEQFDTLPHERLWPVSRPATASARRPRGRRRCPAQDFRRLTLWHR